MGKGLVPGKPGHQEAAGNQAWGQQSWCWSTLTGQERALVVQQESAPPTPHPTPLPLRIQLWAEPRHKALM